MDTNPYPRPVDAGAPISPADNGFDQGFSDKTTPKNPSGKSRKNPCETTPETRPLRSVAAGHLRRGRHHVRPVRDCGRADQLDLFTDAQDTATPDLFGPGGDAA